MKLCVKKTYLVQVLQAIPPYFQIPNSIHFIRKLKTPYKPVPRNFIFFQKNESLFRADFQLK